MELAVRGPGGAIVAHTHVDEVDALWASQYKWHLTRAGYVARNQRRGKDRKPYRMFLHREILGLKHGYKGDVVDHIDGDPLNNLRDNLRVVDHSANAHNRKATNPGRGTSKYRGVSWYSELKCWRVHIMVKGERTLVGYFDDELEAARAAYDFYVKNAPFANVTAPPGPGAIGDHTADVQPSGPGRGAAISDNPDS